MDGTSFAYGQFTHGDLNFFLRRIPSSVVSLTVVNVEVIQTLDTLCIWICNFVVSFNFIWISWYFYFALAEIRNSDSQCLFDRKVFIKTCAEYFYFCSDTSVHSAGWSIWSFTFSWEFFCLPACEIWIYDEMHAKWNRCLLSANYNFLNDYGVYLTTNARNQRSGSRPETWGVMR